MMGTSTDSGADAAGRPGTAVQAVVPGEILAGPDTGTVTGECRSPADWDAGNILVTADLHPSMYALLISARAVVCSAGGLAGHMPAVCRAKGITVIRVAESDLAAVRGTVVIDRARAEIVRWHEELGREHPQTPDRAGVVPPGPTRSGPPGSTCAVVAGSDDIDVANSSGWGRDIERFFIREEFLLLERGLSPLDLLAAGERGRARYAREVALMLLLMIWSLEPHQKIVFRLLDLRSDHAANISKKVLVGTEPNPELGLHGTRWIIESPAYQAMIRSVVQLLGSVRDDVWERIEFAAPFVSDGREFARLRELLELPPGCRLSAFVETPAGVYSASAICATGAAEIFVGTKDLVQLLLAADRGNHLVARSYDTRHPAVLDALTRTMTACTEQGTPVRVFCFARDLDHYVAQLPGLTGYMMDTAELGQALHSPTRPAPARLRRRESP